MAQRSWPLGLSSFRYRQPSVPTLAPDAGMVALIHAYDPEIAVIGEGVMESANIFFPYVESYVHKYAWNPLGKGSDPTHSAGQQCSTPWSCAPYSGNRFLMPGSLQRADLRMTAGRCVSRDRTDLSCCSSLSAAAGEHEPATIRTLVVRLTPPARS